MRQVFIAIMTAGVVGVLASAPASARDYPFCLVSADTGPFGQCDYTSYRQCQASASGRYAYCRQNPRFAQQDSRRQYRY